MTPHVYLEMVRTGKRFLAGGTTESLLAMLFLAVLLQLLLGDEMLVAGLARVLAHLLREMVRGRLLFTAVLHVRMVVVNVRLETVQRDKNPGA